MRISCISRAAITAALSFIAGSPRVTAQGSAPANIANDLDSLIAHALVVSPTVRAASLRVSAARARVGPAGARPDPLLMAALQNQPLSGARDPMTMHMIGISQTIPYPGKLPLRTQAAQRELDAIVAAVDATRLDIARQVRAAYYEIAYADRALLILEQNRDVLADVTRVTEVHYSVGTGSQQDVLRARIEATRLGDEASALREQRSAQVAALNALLDQPSDTPVRAAAVPVRIARAAISDSASHIRFVSDSLGAPAAGSPLPSLASLQQSAVENNPMLREHEARIAAQTARVAGAVKEYKPDIDVSLQYGQRNGSPDMVTALVSVPLPIHRSRKQDQDVAEARAELAALEAEHHAQVNELRAQVAKVYSDIQRERTQLALDVKAIIPQGRASLEAATANYQAGKADLLTLLDARATLFTYETSYHRLVTDFAQSLAELEQIVGKEVLP
jgi:outer membrane protein, heavy metal efflux system